MTEREKMLAGKLYRASDPELSAMRLRARQITREFNASYPDDMERRRELMRSLFGSIGDGFDIEPPFQCDYGTFISAGPGLFMNFGCVILDVCEVRIGRQVLFGPGVHIYAATHPIDATERSSGVEFGRPITIGDRVWIGGGAIILPGVTVGDDSVIGAGSVVTKNIPARSVAVGNPCRVVRRTSPA